MKYFLHIVLIFISLSVFSQSMPDSVELSKTGLDQEEIEAAITKKKIRFNLEMGTTFGASRYGSYLGTYVAPRISYQLTNRFSLSTGVYLSGITNLSGNEAQMYYSPFGGGIYSRSLLFVEGAYRLTDNLTVSGTVYKEFNAFGNSNPNYPGSNFEAKGVIMGVDYKIGENVFIRGQVEISNGRNPYSRNPMFYPGGHRMNDPFFYHH